MASQCCSIHMCTFQRTPYKSSISIGFSKGRQPSVYYVKYISNSHMEKHQCLKYAFEIMHCGSSAAAS
eukprot:12590-Heterococcus_DN1.PRE.5